MHVWIAALCSIILAVPVYRILGYTSSFVTKILLVFARLFATFLITATIMSGAIIFISRRSNIVGL